jgi:hypothetical protein
MKRILYIVVLTFLISGCSKLTDVLEVTPPNNLTPDNVAKNKEGVRNLLNGAYASLHNQYYYQHTEAVPSALAGIIQRGASPAFPDLNYQDNNLLSSTANVNNLWIAFYKLINQTNWVIQLANELPAGELSDIEKEQIIAQAKALRGMATFDALRFFGQYYDVNSAYGVLVRTQVVDFTNRHLKRSSVAETYTQILSDLDEAIEKAPDFTKAIYFSKTAAKAFKAKVMLYKGDYTIAAKLADEVITEGKRSLSPTFAAVFSSGFASTEMIFMRATDAVTYVTDRKKVTYSTGNTIITPWLKTFMAGDPRATLTFNATNNYILKINNATFYGPTYFIRMAEMYLIKAEGLARTDAPLDEAKASLLVIKSRAFGSPQTSPATTKEALLDEIHAEIIKELCMENGSDWFAHVRFGKIQTIKPKVTSTNQYILPIPNSEMLSNNLFGPQNPGYE